MSRLVKSGLISKLSGASSSHLLISMNTFSPFRFLLVIIKYSVFLWRWNTRYYCCLQSMSICSLVHCRCWKQEWYDELNLMTWWWHDDMTWHYDIMTRWHGDMITRWHNDMMTWWQICRWLTVWLYGHMVNLVTYLNIFPFNERSRIIATMIQATATQDVYKAS